MSPIRILHIVSNMQQGGIENFIMNIYRNIDKNKYQFDFLVHYKKSFYFDDEIIRLGGNIYRLSFMEDKNLLKYCKELDYFFKENATKYQIVHAHMGSLGGIYLRYAKKYNIPIRIAHSHGASHLNTIKGYTKYFLNKGFKYNATHLWACSTEAGRYMYGKKSFEFIPNTIDYKLFFFNQKYRNEIRAAYNIDKNTYVLGNVGRLNLQKNHIFLIKVLKELKNRDLKNKYKLMIIGTGELENKIKKEIQKNGLIDSVVLVGVRKDVEKFYSAFDMLIMPSLFEGLPLTGVEAQISGVRCLFADSITREVSISDNALFFSLKENERKWAEFIMNNINYERKGNISFDNTFDLKRCVSEMENRYDNLLEEVKNEAK